MADVAIRWQDPDFVRPAQDVLVRLVALTDRAYEAGEVSRYLMQPEPGSTAGGSGPSGSGVSPGDAVSPRASTAGGSGPSGSGVSPGDAVSSRASTAGGSGGSSPRASTGTWAWTASLPPDLRTSYQLCPARDAPLRGQVIDQDRWTELISAGLPDPSCPDRLPPRWTRGNLGAPLSVLSMPNALPQPWVARRPESPRGTLERTVLPDGSVVHVYRSPGAADHVTPLLVMFDGHHLLATDVTATFDNLASDGVAGPLTVAIVESICGSAPGGPTRINSLTNAPGLESFVCEDLLPMVESRHQVSADPALRVLVGHSLGAVAALHLAARHPDLFASVVAGSPALWWPGGDGQVRGADVAADYLGAASRAGRLFLDAGTEEERILPDARAFRDELLNAGRPVSYREFRGGHDHACWRGSLADGIVATLG